MDALHGQPKTVEEAMDRMQFFQHSREGRPPKPIREVRAVAPEEEPQGTGDGHPSREIQDGMLALAHHWTNTKVSTVELYIPAFR